MGLAASLDRAVERLEQWRGLDRIAEPIAGVVRRLVPPGAVENTASGTPLGHPAHPMLVALPIGAWSAVPVLDVMGANERATRHLVAVGVMTAVPAAYTGASDWLTTAGAERRVGLFHAFTNSSALLLQAASWQARRAGRRRSATVLSAVALGMTGVAGWLGGHLAYALGVGVDTTVFQQLPLDWTDAMAQSRVNESPTRCNVEGVPIVVFRAEGRIVALADRCTHRGGPLHEGEVADGCIRCPWHGSVFDADGRVRSGPATRPQPSLDVRVTGGRVEVRVASERTLRTNPVGH
jgi:nitrite reductase/ring-hydroxylating ferredoxin subunit/uncharacterized membrane protein